jgi:diacylglycerol kinase (ATP)
MRLAVVVNPHSGRQQGDRVAGEAAALLGRLGHTVVVVPGASAAETREALRDELALGGTDGVVVVGGDGALHGVLDAVAGTQVPVGLVPAGTGNDVARTLGLPLRSVLAAVDVIDAGRTRDLDLMDVDGTLVASVVASGFDSKVNERANALRWPHGRLRYLRAVVQELRVFEPLPFELELDGRTEHRAAMLVAVGNGESFGGGLRICAGAQPDDGLLDVVLVDPVPIRELLTVLPQLPSGRHLTHPAVQRRRVRRVRLAAPGVVAYGDGERLGDLPRTVSVVPGALRVFVP